MAQDSSSEGSERGGGLFPMPSPDGAAFIHLTGSRRAWALFFDHDRRIVRERPSVRSGRSGRNG